jgi:raffinose/stachyose/melibiose transport system substrate-binding protein
MLKKFFSVVICIIMVAAIFGACNQDGGQPATEQPSGGDQPATEQPTTEQPAGTTTLSFFHWKGEEKDTWDQVIAMFEDENPGIKVSMEILPEDQYYTTLQARVMAGDGLDVFMVNPGSRFANFVKADAFYDLSGQPWLSELGEAYLNAGQWEGKQYIIPLSKSFVGLFYNRGLFNELGLSVPKTWDDFLACSQTIKDAGHEVIATGGADAFTATWPWIANLVQYTDNLQVYPNLVSGEYKLTDELFVQTLSPLKELYDRGFWMKDFTGTKYDTSITLFATEQAAMLNNGTWAIGAIRDTNPNLDFSIMVIPNPDANHVAGVQPAQAPCVFSKTKNVDASLKFMEFIFSAPIMEIYGNSTGQEVPNMNAVLTDAQMMEMAAIGNSGNTYPHNYSLWPQLDQDLVADITTQAMTGGDIKSILADAQTRLESLGLKIE